MAVDNEKWLLTMKKTCYGKPWNYNSYIVTVYYSSCYCSMGKPVIQNPPLLKIQITNEDSALVWNVITKYFLFIIKITILKIFIKI